MVKNILEYNLNCCLIWEHKSAIVCDHGGIDIHDFSKWVSTEFSGSYIFIFSGYFRGYLRESTPPFKPVFPIKIMT